MARVNQKLEVVPAGPAHAVPFAALHGRCFARGWDPQAMAVFLGSPACIGVAALLDGELAGLALARSAADEAEILTLAVAAQARRRGVGTALMRAVAAMLAARGVLRLYLEVGTDNAPACALYARMGFERAGVRPGYYRYGSDGHAQDALLLVLRLRRPARRAGGRSRPAPL